MAEDTAAGIAYLRALQRPVGSTTTVPEHSTSAPGSGSGVAPGKSTRPSPLPPREKRRSARYKCEGSAEIQEDGREMRTWATFTDISMRGCYVEAQATYAVGTGLHLKLELNGIRVECRAASVRVTYPHLGMGIDFLDMSEENRSGLEELVNSVSRPSLNMRPRLIAPAATAGPPGGSPAVTDSKAAIDALLQFFETRHMLLREDFLAIVATSQIGAIKS